MSEVKNSAVLDLDPASFSFGMKVRYCRVRIGMRAGRLACLYAQAMGRETPYSGRRIEQMERHDDFPQNPYRRWVIATIVNMGAYFDLSTLGLVPSALGLDFSLLEGKQEEIDLQISNMKCDIEDHQTFLKRSWTQGFRGTLDEAEQEIFYRMDDMSEVSPYVKYGRRRQASRTSCGLHIMVATDIYAARNDARSFLQQTRLAALLAQENRFPDLYAIARLQRGGFFKDQRNHSLAFDELQIARSVKGIPQQLRGKILSEAGSVKMRTAHTEKERDEAQRLFDEAESLIDGSTLDDFDFLVAFSDDKYQLERGEGWIGSSEKNLRDPAKALGCLPVLCQADALPEKDFQTVGHRQAHNHLLQAEIAIEQGDYSEAATLALEALNYMEHLQSMVHLKKLVRIYHTLKQGPDCHNENVRVLEVRIARHLYPERFCKDDEG